GLGSTYEINKDSYTLQSVKGHRYWIAPLTFHNFFDEINMGSPVSPGYVVVDAEDPDAEPEIKQGYKIRLFTDQIWGLSLTRFLYQYGYTDGILDDPTLEVDDDWTPYWVVTYIRRPF